MSMPAIQSKPSISPPPVRDSTLVPRCKVEELSDGSIVVSLLIDSPVVKRLKLRAGPMPLHRYIYEQVLNRAVVDHVY